ncbi:MAG: hypothetical protein ACRDDY_15130 [Clostridium sp.]
MLKYELSAEDVLKDNRSIRKDGAQFSNEQILKKKQSVRRWKIGG